MKTQSPIVLLGLGIAACGANTDSGESTPQANDEAPLATPASSSVKPPTPASSSVTPATPASNSVKPIVTGLLNRSGASPAYASVMRAPRKPRGTRDSARQTFVSVREAPTSAHEARTRVGDAWSVERTPTYGSGKTMPGVREALFGVAGRLVRDPRT